MSMVYPTQEVCTSFPQKFASIDCREYLWVSCNTVCVVLIASIEGMEKGSTAAVEKRNGAMGE